MCSKYSIQSFTSIYIKNIVYVIIEMYYLTSLHNVSRVFQKLLYDYITSLNLQLSACARPKGLDKDTSFAASYHKLSIILII